MGKILAILRGIFAILIMAIFVIGYGLTTPFIKNTPERAFRLRRKYVALAIPLFGIKVEKEGGMISEPCLIVGNHKTLSDPLIASKYLDAYVIAKAEVANIPVLKQGADLTGIIYVKRDSLRSRANTRQAYKDTVLGGHNVLVYPEGTTSSEIQTIPFKKGTFRVAAEEGFPVVPIAISYKSPRDLWSQGGLVKQYFRQFGKWRTHAKFWIGPPLRSDDWEYLVTEAQGMIDKKLIEMDQEWKEQR